MRGVVFVACVALVGACTPKKKDEIKPESLRDAYCVAVLEAQKDVRERYGFARSTFQAAATATGEAQAAGCAAAAGGVANATAYMDGFYDAGYSLATVSRVKPETLRLRKQLGNVEKRCRDADMTVIEEITAAEQEIDQAVAKQIEFCKVVGFKHPD